MAHTNPPTINGFNPSANSFVPINFNPNNNTNVPIISLKRLDHLEFIDGEVAKTPNLISWLSVLYQFGK